MADAQSVFASLLRDELAPFIRAREFRGSGSTFRRRGTDGAWAILNFQRWRGSTREALRFTVNLSAASEALRRLSVGWVEGKPPGEADGVIRERLGFLLWDRTPADYWWELDANTDIGRLVMTLKAYLDDSAFPFLVPLTSNLGIRDHLTSLLHEGRANGRELNALRELGSLLGPPGIVAEAEHALEEWQERDVDLAPILEGIANAARGSKAGSDRVIRTPRTRRLGLLH